VNLLRNGVNRALRTVAMVVPAQDVHALAQGELLLANRRHLAAFQILEHEGIAKTHDLPVDPENRVAVLVRDVEILADRDEPCRIV
jgi:hypothetical protein